MADELMDESLPALSGEGTPKTLLVLRGLPASGKSTWARAVVAAYPPGVIARINNDELCEMLFGDPHSGGPAVGEGLVRIRSELVASLLAIPDVRMVIMDNTNLSTRTVAGLAQDAIECGATLVVDDRFLAVPVEECLRRNAARPRPVPDDVMERMIAMAAELRG